MEALEQVQQVIAQTRRGSVTALIVVAGLLTFANGVLTMMSFKWTEIVLASATALIGSILLYYCQNKDATSLMLIGGLVVLSISTIVAFLVAEYDENEGYSWTWRLSLGIPYFILGIGMFMTMKSLCSPVGMVRTAPIMPRQPVGERVPFAQQRQFQRKRAKRRYRRKYIIH